MAGNRVIGYHGEGGLEYWNQPIFEEIHRGDILGFADAVEREVIYQNTHPDAHAEAFGGQISKLAARYSAANELENLTAFVGKMSKLFAAGL